MLFLHEFERIEAEAFLTLAAEMIEEDGIVTAEEDALLEKKKAEEDMKREIADISAQLTGKLLEREMKPEDHRELIDSFLQELDGE